MLAKAVAHHTTAAFIRVVGSEFVQVRKFFFKKIDGENSTSFFFSCSLRACRALLLESHLLSAVAPSSDRGKRERARKRGASVIVFFNRNF